MNGIQHSFGSPTIKRLIAQVNKFLVFGLIDGEVVRTPVLETMLQIIDIH